MMIFARKQVTYINQSKSVFQMQSKAIQEQISSKGENKN
jgi:hypothetical protein